MLHAGIRARFIAASFLITVMNMMVFIPKSEASCGAVTCFVVIGSQQQVPQAGLLTVNSIYNYTPMRLLDGTSGVIPAVDQGSRQMILDHHKEARTITQQATLDLNYGVTDRFGLQITVPYMWRTHKHIDGLGEDGPNGEGEATSFSSNGIGDIRVGLKYNVLPTLRRRRYYRTQWTRSSSLGQLPVARCRQPSAPRRRPR